MGRPALPAGAWGKIRKREVAPNRHRATARYHDHDGQTRTVQAFGTSGAAAERALRQKLTKRAPRVDGPLQSTAPLSVAAQQWFKHEQSTGRLAAGSLATYRQTLDYLAQGALWRAPVGELGVVELDRYLLAEAAVSEARAGRLRVVLSHTLSFAVRVGALDRNVIGAVRLHRTPSTDDVTVFTLDELVRLRRTARAYQEGEYTRAGGRRPSVPIGSLVDVIIGAGGLRLGEALALVWAEVDLDGDPPTVRVTGTVRHASAIDELGFVGTYRQPKPKSKKSRRRVPVDRRAAEALALQPRGDSELVFATASGTPYSKANVNRTWRRIRDLAGIPDAKIKTLRATVATFVDQAHGTRDAALLLGHASEGITREAYIRRPDTAPDVRAVLDALDD